jgi:predicted dehydrogenase
MKKAADENGKILNIGVCNRFHESVVRIKDLIEKGEIGEMYQIYCSFRAFRSIPALGGWFTTKALSGGGALIDWGVHFLDLINYCIGNFELKTVSAVCHSKLAVNMKDYVYRSMHAGPPKYDGVYDVEEYVTGLIRTSGPALTFSGAWAQNIDEEAMFIEFMGIKGGIKLKYGGHYTLYSTKNGELVSETPDFEIPDMYAREIAAFAECAVKKEKIRSNIDNILITARMMDAIYESSNKGKEITL